MKFRSATTAGLLLASFGSASWAISPCVERPTPPPCCADGHCIANPLSFGWYETRWRRWPLESVVEAPKGPAGEIQLGNQIPRFEAPPAEEEDRKAPPPTAPPEVPAGKTAPTGPTTGPPGAEGTQAPPRTQGEQIEPTGPRRPLPAYEPQNRGATPGARPTNSTGPTGELDPPPALPFGPHLIREPATVREASRGPALPAARTLRAANIGSSNDDPPPALPGTLANLSN